MADEAKTQKAAPTRDATRAKIFAAENKQGESVLLKFFGTEIELKQPSIGEIQKFGENVVDGGRIPFAQILVDYAYVPGTTEKVFELGDIESLNQLPFNADIQAVVDTIEQFTNLSVKDAEKN